MILRDRTGLAQVVVKDEATLAQVDALTEETTVEVVGQVSANPQAPAGVEIVDPVLPRAHRPSGHAARSSSGGRSLDASLPTMLDHAAGHLAAPAAAGEVAARRGVACTASGPAGRAGFTEVHSPKLVESATESGANVFEVDYFGRPAYLAQSPQFYKQVLVGIFERVYEVGPVFRAEPHDTVRHLAEYVSLDVELGFIDDHRDVIAVLRDVVAGMVAAHPRAGVAAVALLGADIPVVPARVADHPLPEGAGDRRRAGRRARPGPRARASAGRLGEAGARQRLRRGRGIPDRCTGRSTPTPTLPTRTGRVRST